MSRHIYTLKKPASWHKELWREALPLGNGLTGVLIPGAIGKESITFNRHDLWEGSRDPEVPDITQAFYEQRQAIDEGDYGKANQENISVALSQKGYCPSIECPHPLGWLNMEFVPAAPFKNYRRGINMETGEAFVEFTVAGFRYSRRAFVSRDSDITVIRMWGECPFSITYDFNLYNATEQSYTGSGEIYRASKDKYTQVQVHFTGEYTSKVSGNSLTVTGQDYMILIRCGSNGSDCSLNKAAGKMYSELLDKHISIYKPLYNSVSLELSPEEEHLATNEMMLSQAYEDEVSPALLERLWRFGRYLFISAASEEGTPVPLYGLWHGSDHLAWSQFVANENVEITYWHTMAGGLCYSIPPLLRYYTKKTEKLRECAKNVFGTRGIWISAYTTPNTSGFSIPVSVITNWISCAGWLCRHFWDYYLYTEDEELLRKEILPFMYEAALFYLDYAVDDGEYIRLYPAVSPENCPAGIPNVVAQNATMDFAILKELLTNLLTGMELTGMYKEQADAFKTLLGKIPPYQLNEEGAVKEWMHPDLKDNYYHRHLSHIYPVFPGTEITAHNNPALFDAFKKAVKLRKLGAQSGWSLAHMASIYARMGEGEKSAECLDVMAKNVIMDSLMTTHNDWRNMGTTIYWSGESFVQLDAAFGAVNAVQEMLFCWQKEALSILPALPARLTRGAIRGLVFPQGTIDMSWTEEGNVTVNISVHKDLNTTIFLKGIKQCPLSLQKGENKTLSFHL